MYGVHVWGPLEAKNPIRGLSSSTTSNLIFETGSLTDPRTHHMGWLASSQDAPLPSHHILP